jgi:hypothetical protein
MVPFADDLCLPEAQPVLNPRQAAMPPAAMAMSFSYGCGAPWVW